MSTPAAVIPPSCPRCKAPMILRNGSRGPFFGCSTFPRCKGTVDAGAVGTDGAPTGRPRTTTPGGGSFRATDVFVPDGAAPVSGIAPRTLALDADQSVVCGHRKGEAVAAAAAGSGKSTVLVERAADLISEGVLPEAILILTFNADAAKSLRAKLTARLGADIAGRTRALTYHAYGRALLSKWSAGDDSRLDRIIGASEDAPSKASLFGKVLRQLSIKGEVDDWAEIDERIREGGIDIDAPDAIERVAASRWGGGSHALAAEIVAVSAAYARMRHEQQLVDFSDLICIVAQEFARGTERAHRAACFAHVMIDEAQDTNSVQQQIARFLGAAAVSLLWVGDLRQSIYGWRGAEPSLLTDRIAAGAALLPIRTCRRSTHAIVEAGNAIARGRDWHLGGDSVARTEAAQGSRPFVRHGGASDVADEIAAAVRAGASPADFAALARVNSALSDLEISCVARGLPVRVLGSRGGIWETAIGRCIRGYLHAAEGRAQDLARISNRPLRYMKGDSARSAEAAVKQGRPLVAALRGTGDRGAAQLAWDLVDLEKLDYVKRCDRVAEMLMRDVQDRAAGLKAEPDEDRLDTIKALCRAASELGSTEMIEGQVKKIREAKEDQPAVILSTVHRSKGLEFRNVFVVGCADGSFPHAKAEDIEEETRLFYVATTRAADSLTYFVPDGEGCPSFITEMGDAVDIQLGDDLDGDPDGGGGGERRALDRMQSMLPPASTDIDSEAHTVIATAMAFGGAQEEERRLAHLAAGPLSGPTPTDADIGPDAAPAPGGKYVPVRLAALRALLEPLGFTGAAADRGNQYVFVKPAQHGVAVRVYTTIPVGETVSREAGEDSIRVTAIWSGHDGKGKPMLKREPYVCRTAGWRAGILDRVGKVEGLLRDLPSCDRCGQPMRDVKPKSGGKSFYGCIGYPECRGTMNKEVS